MKNGAWHFFNLIPARHHQQIYFSLTGAACFFIAQPPDAIKTIIVIKINFVNFMFYYLIVYYNIYSAIDIKYYLIL